MTTKTLKVKTKTIKSFKEIDKVFNNGYYSWLEEDKTCRDAILAPVVSKEEDLVLFYPDESIPGGKEVYKYFAEKGYEVVEKAHPSLLVEAMNQLTEEKLTELGIPTYVKVILPTDEDSLLPFEYGDLCFLDCYRNGGDRKLGMTNFRGEWGVSCAFLLRKKTSRPLDSVSPFETLIPCPHCKRDIKITVN